jgi:hypothetical protein
MNYLKTLCLISFSVCITSLYATTLGQISLSDPKIGNRTIIYEAINDYAVVEGDILLGRVSQLNRRGAVTTPVVSDSRWPQGLVPYQIDEKLPFLNKLAILQAIDHWQKNSHIQFIELNSTNHKDYADYIAFIPGGGTMCASYVGRQKGKQEINLSPRCTTMNTVHEIGHALGLWHEQSRADRDSFVRIVWENIEEDHQYNFNQHLTDGNDFGEYDYQSIMHYGPLAFSKNGQPTIIPLIDGVEIGQRNQLSEKDIAAINNMYPQ